MVFIEAPAKQKKNRHPSEEEYRYGKTHLGLGDIAEAEKKM